MCTVGSVEKFVLTDSDQDDVLGIIDTAYTPREPLCLGLHCTSEEMTEYFEDMVKRCIESEASFGIRDTSSGELIGVMLNLILTSQNADVFKPGSFTQEKSNLYSKVLHEFCIGINVLDEDGVKKQLELVLLTVHLDHCGKGLAKELIRLSEEKGVEMECDIATIQATNPITNTIVNRMGYKTLRRMDLSTVKGDDGKQILDQSAMKGTTHFIYLTKHL